LLRIPRTPTKHQMYGIAVHDALKDFFDSLKDQMPDKEYLLSQFSHYLNRQPLSQKDFVQSLEKGNKSLGGYYDEYHASWQKNTINEFKVSGIMLTTEIRLTGKIDKIELVDSSSRVNVVDYKTGKPKTRGEIEGSTKNSNGNIKRQLVFYNLLLNKYDNGKYQMLSGDIDFIEPDIKARYKKESFTIEPEEVSDLEKTIKNVSTEILSLAFWDQKCDNKDCEFCALREMMTSK